MQILVNLHFVAGFEISSLSVKSAKLLKWHAYFNSFGANHSNWHFNGVKKPVLVNGGQGVMAQSELGVSNKQT